MIQDCPEEAHKQAPASPPITRRAMNDGGALRLGVFGGLSLTYSPSAARVKIATAGVEPINDKKEPCRFNIPRRAAQLIAAGAVMARSPATIPMSTARTNTR